MFTGYSSRHIVVVAMASNGVAADAVFFQRHLSPVYVCQLTPAACPALGTATVTVTGGTAAHTYQWMDQSNNTVGTTNPVSLPSGNYRIQITDANGCTFGSVNNFYDSLFISSIPAFDFDLQTTTANCTNGTATVDQYNGRRCSSILFLFMVDQRQHLLHQ